MYFQVKMNDLTVENYLANIPEDKKASFQKLRQTVLDNLPKGFEEGINYKMIGYYVPHTLYPAGYHCDPKLPLPFMNIACQKNFIAFYHMGIYANPDLLAWFQAEFPKHSTLKLDMGKSCIRFKKCNEIPYKLMGELVTKMTAKEWIAIYEKQYKR